MRSEVDAHRKDMTKLRRSATRLHNDNKRLEEELATAKDYAKRVESRLVHGTNGRYILEQNAKLRDQLQALKTETGAQQRTIETQEVELKKATAELEVLSRAVELRSEELQLDGDLKAGMLYQVAKYKQENRHLTVDGADKTRASRRQIQMILVAVCGVCA